MSAVIVRDKIKSISDRRTMTQRSQNWPIEALRTVLLLLVVAALGAALFYLLSPTQKAVGRQSTIDVRGEASVATRPDRAVVTFDVVTDAPDAAQADADNQQRTAALTAALKTVLQRQDTVETINYSVFPRFETIDGQRRETGQRASQSIQVTFNGLDQEQPAAVAVQNNSVPAVAIERVGQTIALGLREGATGVAGPQFSVSENNPARARARALSVQVAESRAQQLAAQAGVTLRALRFIKDQDFGPIAFARDEAAPVLQRSATLSSAIVPPKEERVSHAIEASYYVS